MTLDQLKDKTIPVPVNIKKMTLLVIKIVTLQLSHVSLKGWDVFFEDAP